MKSAPVTFDTKLDASAWLADYVEGAVVADHKRPDPSLAEYADTWLASRELKPRTRAHYRDLLDDHIIPTLGALRLTRLSPDKVRAWYGSIDPNHPTLRAHAYGLLRTIYTTAISDQLVAANPCRIRGAGSAKTKHQTTVATLPELEVMVAALPERYRPMALLAAWCGLRFGELAELRRGDVDIEGRLLRVTRGVARANGQVFIGDPKSDAGRRSVSVPPHLMPVIEAHLSKHVGKAPGALVFPARNGGSMAPSSLYRVWYPARAAAGRSELRFHDLRHSGLTWSAATGASVAELMRRAGHASQAAALRYQHATDERDRALARALAELADLTNLTDPK